jgi:hypothetical protein
MAAPSSDAESVQAIREALGTLITGGLLPYNVGENGGCLLDLDLVKARREVLDGDADEGQRYEADAKALRAVLEVAVEHDDISGKHRRLLRAVLPLDPDLLGKSIKDRREVAGEVLKPGKKAVTAGTIRNYYEPKALDKIVGVLWKMELEFQVKATPPMASEPTLKAQTEGSGS